MFDVLLRDPKFWTALLFLVQTLVFYFLPAFPQEIWAAITALLRRLLFCDVDDALDGAG